MTNRIHTFIDESSEKGILVVVENFDLGKRESLFTRENTFWVAVGLKVIYFILNYGDLTPRCEIYVMILGLYINYNLWFQFFKNCVFLFLSQISNLLCMYSCWWVVGDHLWSHLHIRRHVGYIMPTIVCLCHVSHKKEGKKIK